MRLSPLLAAILAITANLSLSKLASGQTPESVASETAAASQPVEANPEASAIAPAPEEVKLEAIAPAPEEVKPEAIAPAPEEIKSEAIAPASMTVETNSVPEFSPQPVAQTPAPTPTPAIPTPPANQPEPQVLVAEVQIRGAEGDLVNQIYRAIRTQPGRTTNRSQLQEDVNAIFATGYFANVEVVPEDTPLGVRVTFVVQPNPVLQNVTLSTVPEGTAQRIVPQSVIDEIFSPLYGRTLNLRELQEAIKQLNQYYKDQGYDLAQVIAAPQVSPDGTITLVVAEGVIEDIQVRFLNKDGEAVDDEGQPIRGRTRPFIITREIELKPGDVFNRQTAERDLRRVFGLGIFEDVRLSFNPGTDPRKVVVVVDTIEKNTGSIGAGAGFSSASGLFGTVSYQEQNLGGNNQDLGGEIQLGQRELLFDVRFTDPWIGGDPNRTSYSVNAFRRRSISLIFDGGEREVDLPNGDRPRVLRLGGGVTFTRPIAPNPFVPADFTASAGLQYQRVSIRDGDGDLSPRDELGNDLSFSGSGIDDLTTIQLGLARDRRDNPLQPTSGSLLRLGVEQSIPIGSGSILLNRLRGSYSYYLPVKFTNFSEGIQSLAFNLQGGTVLGDLPPYEAFSLGGSNSVRGYDEGELGSGRSYIQATAEYRFPLFSIISGALFADFGTDLGTGGSVPGDPAGIRDKPGTGFGYGLGVRVRSPLGPIRVDYGLNSDGEGRIHFGIGEKF